MGLLSSIGSARNGRLMIVLASWAIGLVLGGVSLGVPGTLGLVMFLVAGGDPRAAGSAASRSPTAS